ncbi:hypothetical protein [Pseudoalteromonas sp. BDTF-M6]|uniref:hypothetical protein n=1 Tax=Pseudoalteromonas sp. BDTF-M6 TaxID=2796132 RepID=UPI001BAFD2D8|nr:hypothetical protein [Pseudoalteromonas sp. BDTF-M6]MBS3798118.1 hypothetical protein [Pseudoalteromonas sp. BDTF-M6]
MEVVIYSKSGAPHTEPKDNHYSALRLEKLERTELARVRTKLYCSGCFEKAAYVARSSNGRAPHCRSVHQLVDGSICPERSAESEKVSTQGYESVQALKNEGDVYVVDFNFELGEKPVNPHKPKDDSDIEKKKRGAYRKYGEASGEGKSEWSRRLSTLLKTLKEDPQFARSTAHIKVFGVPKPIRNAFYNTEKFSNYMEKLTPGKFPTFFWGPIWDANEGIDGTVWLNTGEDSLDLSIKIPKDIFKVLKTKCKLSYDDPCKELNGSWFLLYGWYNKSRSSGKPFLTLLEPHPEFITLRLSS